MPPAGATATPSETVARTCSSPTTNQEFSTSIRMRSAVASGGLPDLPTMQLLLNAQKTFLQAKGKNVGP